MNIPYIILRFVKLFTKFNWIKDSYTLRYKGKGVSLNNFYSAGHWSKRHSLKKKFTPIFKDIFDKKLKGEFLNEFALVIFYNSRHDPDNVTGLEKLFMDSLRSFGYVTDDSKKYYKLFCVIPDESLETNEFNFLLIKLK